GPNQISPCCQGGSTQVGHSPTRGSAPGSATAERPREPSKISRSPLRQDGQKCIAGGRIAGAILRRDSSRFREGGQSEAPTHCGSRRIACRQYLRLDPGQPDRGSARKASKAGDQPGGECGALAHGRELTRREVLV